jgi:hypothetical protein
MQQTSLLEEDVYGGWKRMYVKQRQVSRHSLFTHKLACLHIKEEILTCMYGNVYMSGGICSE